MNSDEPANSPPYFAFSASLRILGDIADWEAISRALNLQPTDTHRRGERGRLDKPQAHDAWIYEVQVTEESPATDHVLALCRALEAAKDLASLRDRYSVDVFCGYRSDSDYGSFSLSAEALSALGALGLPAHFSVIIT
jgi:Domain of unknown function (DUF4279)